MIINFRRVAQVATTLCFIISAFFQPFAYAIATSPEPVAGYSQAKNYRSGEVIVKLKDGSRPFVVRFPDDASVNEIAQAYEAHPEIEYAEPNYTVTAAAIDPSDPYYANQWYLRQINMPSAWDITTGSHDVVVAVIDSGVDINHPDLRENIWTNVNEIPGDEIDNDRNGYTDDVHGWDFVDWSNDPRPSAISPYSRTALHHGTVISGVIGAVTNNAQGTAGINWRVRLMPLRVLDRQGRGDVEQVAQAVDYAVRNGARIINLSFVGNDFSQRLYDSLRSAYLSGVLIVAAAGNTSEQVGGTGDLDKKLLYPVCYDAADTTGENWILGVTATDILDQRIPTANYGSRCVDIAAPGANFTGTQVYDPALGLVEPYGGNWSGTSLATPVVTAVAALLLSAEPHLSNRDLFSRLVTTSDDISALNRSLKDKMGRGRVNASRALRNEVTPGQAGGATMLAAGQIIASASGFLPSEARLVSPSGTVNQSWSVFDRDFRFGGGVAVTENARLQPSGASVKLSAILRGDQQVIFGEGRGGAGKVRLYDVTGQRMAEWYAFDRPFGGGIAVASGDVFGSGEGNVVVMPQSGGGAQVRIFDREGKLRSQFFAYDHRLRGGFSVAVGDIDGDGVAEIITSSTTAALPVRIFKANGALVAEWLAYPQATWGVQLAAGDIDGDGVAEIVTTPTAPRLSTVSIFQANGRLLGQFSALPAGLQSRVNVALGDVNGDGRAEIVTAPYAAAGSQVRIFDNHARLLGQFFVYDKRKRGGLSLAILR